MNTFWLKVATLVVVVAAAVVLIGIFTSSEKSPPQPKPREKTFQDMVERDKEEFLKKPKTAAEQTEKSPPSTPAVQQPAVAKQTPPEPTKLYFKPLSEMEKIEAERLLNAAVPGRSIGRLPMASGTGFKLMVDSCRQIIRRWPDSWYAYNAQRMLIDMPERFRDNYKITPEELDISRFTKQRPGTKLYTGADTAEEESF
ncbi:MAG: hypothetical protein JW947_10080 [Sedimentisphaerales bacterium]|nr:hypothetical protein [Sedimentisphaerales bacterium]